MANVRNPTVEERAGCQEWAALGVLLLPVLMVSVDTTVLSFALPAISTALSPTGTQLLWIVDVYALMLAGLLIVMGSLGDRIGRRRLLLIGAVGFGLASVAAACATGPQQLLLARALLGVFGATLMPSTLSLLRNVFTHPGDRRVAVAAWAAMFSGGAALGPVLGGVLLEHGWWGAVFLINVPVVAVFVPLAAWLLPESRDPRPGPVDAVSIVLAIAAMSGVVYAIKHVATHGVDDTTVLALGVGVGAGTAFVRRQTRRAQPMVDVGLFRDRTFSGALAANLLSLMGLTGFLFFAAQLLQLDLGLDPLASAIVLVPGLVVTIVAGFMAVRLVRHVSVRLLVGLSFVASAAGYALLVFTPAPGVAAIGIAFAVLGAGIGVAETLTNDVVLTSAPPHRAGAAAALSETAYEIGAVLGTAVLGSIVTSTFRSHLDVPVMLRADGTAHETLGSTLQRADQLPGHLGDPLAESARAAFELGVQRSSAVAMAVAVVAALISWRTLRGAGDLSAAASAAHGRAPVASTSSSDPRPA